MNRLIGTSAVAAILSAASLAACSRPSAPAEAKSEDVRFNIPATLAPRVAVKEDVTYPDVEAAGRDPFLFTWEQQPTSTGALDACENPPCFFEPPPPPPPPAPPTNPPSTMAGMISGGGKALMFFGKSIFGQGDLITRDWKIASITPERAMLKCVARGYTALTSVMNFARSSVDVIDVFPHHP